MVNRFVRSILQLTLSYVLFLKEIDASQNWSGINAKSVAAKYEIVNMLNLFICNEERRLNSVDEFVQLFNLTDKSYLATEKYRGIYVGHPVNSYNFIKKLTRDWNSFKTVMNQSSYNESVKAKVNKTIGNLWFLRRTLNDTISTIGKMQEMYNLWAEDIAVGIWGKHKFNFDLTYEAIIKIGKYFYDNLNYGLASQWLEISFEKFENKTDYADLIYLLSKSDFLNGNIDKSLDYLDVLPYEVHGVYKTKSLMEHIAELINIQFMPVGTRLNENLITCKNICKGLPTGILNNNLKCRYNKENSPFLKLAPLKEEIVSDEPFIRIFRNVLSGDEIKIIKNMTMDTFAPAETYKSSDVKKASYNIRLSETSFLSHFGNKLIENILKRIEDMSAFSTKNGDELQIAHYGVAGHYISHTDALTPGNNILENGNRIATVLFYMNNVELGGGTVFTKLGIYVEPDEGSALVWHNLLATSFPDERLQHCACPVIIGQKWIMTEWLRELGQISECGLN